MRVYIIGAGPGAADLVTIRGARLIAEAKIVMYAGSLVPETVLIHAAEGARLINTAPLGLPEQRKIYEEARARNLNVARVHSGDPAIYGATAEQMRILEELGIEFEIVPGVSSYTAAAASLGCELTKPDVSQTVILTRFSGRASKVPDRESLAELSRHRATLCLFLSGAKLAESIAELLTWYPANTPAALVKRVSQPEERIHISTLGNILTEIDPFKWRLTTTLIVGEVLAATSGTASRLYDPEFSHRYRFANQNSPLSEDVLPVNRENSQTKLNQPAAWIQAPGNTAK